VKKKREIALVVQGMCYGACAYAALSTYAGIGPAQEYDLLPVLVAIAIIGYVAGLLWR